MNPRLFTALLLVALLVGAYSAASGQEYADSPATTSADDPPPIFLPQLHHGSDSSPPEHAPGEDPFAGIEDPDLPAVTEVSIRASTDDETVAITADLPLPIALSRLDAPVVVAGGMSRAKVHPALVESTGPQQVVIRLSEPSLAENAVAEVSIGAQDNQRAQLGRVRAQQVSAQQAFRAVDADLTVHANLQKAINAIIVETDAAHLEELAAHPAVVSIHPVVDFELALNETVAHIEGRAVQEHGFDGSGVKVAVFDTGIDYTHANLNGAGTVEAFEVAYGTGPEDVRNTQRPDFFPTARVVDGYDFVGQFWPLGPLDPNPNPIDVHGHGTHVADIIGGVNGVAPGVDFYAATVCSSINLRCPGIATLQAIEWALDPNNDGDLSDRVDIINMSFGSPYGQAYDEPFAIAVENLAALGVLTVASAGNSGDRPYVTTFPAVVPSALSVAETQTPSAIWHRIEVLEPNHLAGVYAAVLQRWSVPLSEVFAAPVQYGDGLGGNLLGCNAFEPESLAGKIVLVDRGECAMSLKIRHVADGGGAIGIIGLTSPEGAFEAAYAGGGPITIPAYMISQADADIVRNAPAASVIARFNPAQEIPAIGHMRPSSSRGPGMLTNIIKPEIGAPGASVSAVAGTGTEETFFGGTSGAAPMVTGAAALLYEAIPGRTPAEIKAVLMNTGETHIFDMPPEFGGGLAPISRIGGGEVRVERAVNSPVAAWDRETGAGALSFGFYDVTRSRTTLQRMVSVRNYSTRPIVYEVTPHFRFANDAETGAVSLNVPQQVTVPPRGDAHFPVTLYIDGGRLRAWSMNSGALGGDPASLTLMEYDGYIHFTEIGGSASSLHLAWHVLPRQAGDVTLRNTRNQVRLANRGMGTTVVESYSLLGMRPRQASDGPGEGIPTPSLRYAGYATYPVPPGICGNEASFVMAFAFNSWERQTHANAPLSYWIEVDTSEDGMPNYIIANRPATVNDWDDGRNMVFVQDNEALLLSSFFYTDHETNSGNTVLPICGEQIGMTAADFGRPFTIDIYATDWYFLSGFDALLNITIAPMGHRYLGHFQQGGPGMTVLHPNGMDTLHVADTGSTVNNSETGLLLLYRGGTPEGQEAGIVTIVR